MSFTQDSGRVITQSALRPSPARLPSLWKHFDWVLAGAATLIALFGCLMIWTSTRGVLQSEGLSGTRYVDKQIVFVAVGVAVMMIVAAVDYRKFTDRGWLIYGVVVLALAGVYVVGHASNGAQAWYQIGGFQLEPSEFAKIGTLVFLASVLGQFKGSVRLRTLLTLIGLALIPLLLIYGEPDLGSTLVLGVVVLAIFAVGGVRPLHLGVIALVIIFGVVAVLGLGILKNYQKDRITSFLNTPDSVKPSFLSSQEGKAEYNGALSKEAVSAGGVAGQGVGKGLLTNLGLVPEQYTDFIFSAIGEQVGLLGSMFFLLLFLLVLWRTWRSAEVARDKSGTLLCVGVLAMLGFQVFENVGMAMGIMPIAGITLPWTSYGGTSVIACFAGVGLVLNVRMHRFG